MAISYVGAGTPQARTGDNGTTWTMGSPSGVAAGDLLIAVLTGNSGIAPVGPTGWTRLFSYLRSGSGTLVEVWTKTATASEPASYVFTGGSGGTMAGVVLAYRGASVPTVYATSGGGGNAATAPSVTTTQPNNYVLSLFAEYSGYNNNVFTTPVSDYTVRYNSPSVANASAALEVIDRLQPAAGASPQPQVNDNAQVPNPSTASLVIPISNAAPNAPTLNAPATGSSVDRTQAQAFSWTPSDPDAGDTQSAFTFRYRVQGSTGAWTSVSQTTSATSYTVAANAFADSTQYEWQVATTDSLGAVGPYSASSVFLAATPPPAPTITVPASGATVTGPTSPLTFTAPNVSASRWRVMGDTGGSANTTVVRPGATTNDGGVRTFTVDGLSDNTSVHFQVAVQYQGLWSAWADRQVAVAFTLPAVPVVALTMLPQTDPTNPASLLITITNPTPSGGQPAVVSHEVYLDDGRGSEKRATGLAPGATYLHRTPAAGREYSGGPVRVAAVAASGAKSFGTGTG